VEYSEMNLCGFGLFFFLPWAQIILTVYSSLDCYFFVKNLLVDALLSLTPQYAIGKNSLFYEHVTFELI